MRLLQRNASSKDTATKLTKKNTFTCGMPPVPMTLGDLESHWLFETFLATPQWEI